MLTPSLYYSIVAVESLWLVNHVVENVRDALGEIVCLVPSASLGLKHGALDHANDLLQMAYCPPKPSVFAHRTLKRQS